MGASGTEAVPAKPQRTDVPIVLVEGRRKDPARRSGRDVQRSPGSTARDRPTRRAPRAHPSRCPWREPVTGVALSAETRLSRLLERLLNAAEASLAAGDLEQARVT